MRLMDVVTTYLYGSLYSDIYMKIHEGFKMPEALRAKPKEMYSIKFQRSLYGLKQSGRMWYNRLSDYLTTVYVNDLNIIRTNKEILEAIELLKKEFEMKDLDAGYLSDPHKARSQTGYVFMNGGTAISRCSQKQTLVATSSNHAEIIVLNEASRECIWLRSMRQLILSSCGLDKDKCPILIYEDNLACVTQMKEGYIKSDMTKHIPPKFFEYIQELKKDQKVKIEYVQSSNNVAIFKHVHGIGMRHVHNT
ncbi:uncharacterized protein LOC122194735 [Lactuca sativa]|uniref:uncharacterized protein LOC122194735 n=1 Tax=Lactuca sativa TaxID=4236 RepID=UPI0022B05381|nr:uncharacterized protein LOC122194735 [Lactuca sativa]